MKKIAILQLLVLMFASNFSYSQAPDWTRVLQTNTYGVQFINAIASDAANVYFAAGITGPVTYSGTSFTSIGYRDLIISKTTTAGASVWTKQINAQTGGTIVANAIEVDASGNIYVIGSFTGSITIGSSFITSSVSVNSFYAKFDSNGNGLWASAFLSTGSGASRIALDASGNSYLISGTTKLIKYSSAGIYQWEQNYPIYTLLAIEVYGANLYLGGALQIGTTNFGTIPLTNIGGYNTGFLVKADLNGTFSASTVVGGSTTADGSTVTDIALDGTGNLIITGVYTADLTLGAINIPNAAQSGKNYTYIAKCNSSFTFSWAKSSTIFNNSNRSIFGYRLFTDNLNNIYEWGSVNTFLSYTTVSSNFNGFLFKFDANGNVLSSYDWSTVPITFQRIIVEPGGQILLGFSNNFSGSPSYGDLNIAQYNNTLVQQWQLSSSNNSSGSIKINFVKHDAAGNTYLQSTVLGTCDYFGTAIHSDVNVTVISKHNISGTLLWMKQINDISPEVFGSCFNLDKDNNVLSVGLFQTSLVVGTTTLNSTNTGYEGYVVKYSSNGDFLWASKMNLGVTVNGYISLASDIDGNVLVSGNVSPANYLVKFNPSGTQLWAKTFPMESYFFSLISTDDSNNIYLTSEIHLSDVAGSTTIGSITLSQTHNDGATALIKFDSNGNALWARTYGGVTGATYSDGWPCDIKTDAAGNSFLWGWCKNNAIFGTTTLVNPFATNQDFSYYLAKINTSGDVVWAKAIYESLYAFNYGDLLDLDNLGNIYVGGHFKDKINIDGSEFTPVGTNDFFVAKYSNAGTFQWMNTIPANSIIINSLNVFGNNSLSIVGNAGINPTIGAYTINTKGGSNGVVATLGNLTSIGISSFSPTSGPVGTAVTITGMGFSTTPANNVVWFGAVQANVTATTSTSLTVTVPLGATYQPITITVNGLTAYSSKPFNVTFPSSQVVDATSFAAKVDFTTGTNPYTVALSDLDGDSKPDLIVANTGGNTVSVYRNTSNSGSVTAGSFTTKVDFATGTTPDGVAIGDVDGDGKPDLVIANGGNTVSVLRNNCVYGSITVSSFDPKVDFPAGTTPRSVAIGDIDGDGKPDLVVTNGDSNNVSVYRNTSTTGTITTSSFNPKVDFSAGTRPVSVAINDLDGDGKLDLVIANEGSNTLSVYRNTSISGSMSASSFDAKVDFTTGSNPYGVAIGDLDGDGKPDIAVASAYSNAVSVFRNTSVSGSITVSSFSARVDFTAGVWPFSVAIGDIDGDGKPDLAAANYTSGTVSVFRNTSISGSITSSSFTSKVDFTAGTNPWSVAIGDVDRDGKPDLTVANYNSNTVSVFRNTMPVDASWSKTIGGPTDDLPASIVFDGIGNFYIVGSFTGTVDFDPGTGVDSKTSNGGSDIFLSKFSNDGSYLWTKTFGSTGNDFLADYYVHNMLSVDNSNNIYVATYFSGSVDFDPGTGTDIKNSNGLTDVCLIKINADGSYGWTKVFGGSDAEIAQACIVDNSGNVFVGGSIASSNIDFDPGTGQDLGSGTYQSPFIWKINYDGSYGWKKIFNINTWGYCQLNALRFDNSQNLFAIGEFEYTVDFDPGAGTDLKTSGGYNDIFLTKLNSDYSYNNTKTIGSGVGSNNQIALDLSIKSNGSQYYTGYIQKYSGTGSVDMDPTSGIDIKNPVNGADFFLTKLTDENTYAWTKLWTGTGVSLGFTITFNGSGEYYVTGSFAGTMDFDPGSGVDSKTALGTSDIFLMKFNADDSYAWTKTFGGTGATTNYSSVKVYNNYIYLIGSFTGTIDLDPTAGVLQKTAIGGNDIFMVKLSTISELSYLPPTITSFTPTSGPIGTTVTLTGPNFSTTPANNIVWFGAVRASVTAATSTSLTVTVPTGATYQPISVTVNGLTAYSSKPFNVTFPSSQVIDVTSFAPKIDLTTGTGTNPHSMVLNDIDDDGKSDLTYSNSNSNTISVLRNISSSGLLTSGSFATKIDFPAGTYPAGVAYGDIDGDGKPDLAVVNSSSNTVSIFQNISASGSITAGSFSSKVDFATGTFPAIIAFGDIDGDGKPDMVISNITSNSISVYRNTSTYGSITTGSFAAKVDFNTGIDPMVVAIGDIDGDGKPDITIANRGSNTISVFRNTSISGSISASSFATKVDFSTGTAPVGLATGDIDGDNKLDIVATNTTGNSISVFRNTSTSGSITSSSFATKVDFTTGLGPNGVTLSDLDGDSKPDLVVKNYDGGTISVFRNTSSSGSIGVSSLSSKIDFTTGTNPQSIAIGDMDGDGKPDLAIANYTSNTISVFRNTIPTIVLPPTITSFSPTSGPIGITVTITGTNFSTTAANNIVWFGAVKATVTAATSTSLSVTVPTGATYQPISVTVNGLTAYSGKPFNITFPSSKVIDATSFAPKVDLTTGNGPYSVAICDIDGDGKSDLAVANQFTNMLSLYRNNSTSGTITTGSFSAKIDFASGTQPCGVAAGDIDSDGKPDLAVINNTNSTVSVYKNISTSGSITTGSFAGKIDFATGTNPHSIAIGDIDGDGKPDLVIANYGSSSVSILRNTSTTGSIAVGSFATKYDLTVGASPRFVKIGDIDGDGKADIVVTIESNNTVSVFRNTSTSGSIGAGSFATKVDFTPGITPFGINLGDIDGDGKLDMLVANYSDNNVSIFRNTSTSGTISSSSFATKVNFGTGLGPFYIELSDLDGDGKPDLTVANDGSGSISILRNLSTSGSINTGSLATKVDFTAGTRPISLAIGDLDGDGKPDLAATNYTSNTVSVFRNTIPAVILPPTITSFTPTSGPIGTAVTITGTNFSATTSNNVVWFGAVKATVTSSTSTSLSVTVPVGATYQPITVTVNGLTACSSTPFNITFTSSGIIDGTSLATKVDISTGSGTNPYIITVNDVDADGKSDLVVANFTNSTVSIYRNISTSGSISSGSFAAKVDFTTGTQPNGIAIGDIDGDGKPDIAIANYGSNTISVYQNNSTSGSITTTSFAPKIDFIAGINPTSIAIGDIDGDGKPDIAATNGGSGDVSIFRNTSNVGTLTATSFANKVDFSAGAGTNGIAIGDIDGDGKPDLAISNYGGTAAILRNTCTIGSITSSSFATKVDFATGTNPRDIAIGDIDGDGKFDIAISNEGSNTVSVFRNISSPGTFTTSSFSPKVDFPTATGPWGVSFGDLNGDVKLDLIVTNNSGASVSIFKNTSTSGSITTGSLAPKVDFTSGANPYNVAFGDLDNDGKPDLVTANNTGNSLSLYRNLISSSASVPTITSFTPSSGLAGSSVTINGTNFGSTQGTSTVKFGTTTATATSWSATQIIATVPTLTAGVYTISVTTTAGTANSSTQYTVTTTAVPTVTSFTPSSGLAGSSVTINGTNFGSTQGTSTVKFGTTTATATSWSATQIIATVPTLTAGVYTISVTTTAGTANSSTQYTVTTSTVPTITSFTPLSGLVGSTVTITGTNFGSTQGTSTVKFGTTTAAVSSWNTTQIIATVPSIAYGSYTITVTTAQGVANSSTQYTVATPTSPTITSFTPMSGIVGATVTINGSNFGAVQGTSTVQFGTTIATVTSWSASQIKVTVPDLTVGPYTIYVTTSNGTVHLATMFTVTTQQCAIPTVKKKGSLNILICQTANAVSYQWYLNNIAISGATKQFYIARKVYGNYSVQVTLSNGCNDRSIDTPVNTGGSIAVYPNPGDKLFNVEVNLEEMGNSTIKLINAFGVVKRIVNFNKDMVLQTIPVEVDDLEQGVYVIDVEVNGVKIESQKVVIL